jgi:hypothetical protein
MRVLIDDARGNEVELSCIKDAEALLNNFGLPEDMYVLTISIGGSTIDLEMSKKSLDSFASAIQFLKANQ